MAMTTTRCLWLVVVLVIHLLLYLLLLLPPLLLLLPLVLLLVLLVQMHLLPRAHGATETGQARRGIGIRGVRRPYPMCFAIKCHSPPCRSSSADIPTAGRAVVRATTGGGFGLAVPVYRVIGDE